MNRAGVALIIAISVLAALLFLALPFLFSQSASVAGAKSASQDGIARRGVDRAAGLATALSVYATGLHRSRALTDQLGTAQFAYVQLPQQINDQGAAGAIRYPGYIDTSWRFILEPGADWATASGTVTGVDRKDALHGAIIEDESRRIDPNDLDEFGWAVVLRRAEIQDPWTVAWNWDVSLPAKGSWIQVRYGRLARALSYWRPGNNSRRFNRLEDLLGANPEEKPASAYFKHGEVPFYALQGYDPVTHSYPVRGKSGWPVDRDTVEATRDTSEVLATVKDSAQIGWRVAALTQAELERLRPLLSFLVPGQGRSGLIDYGTVVATGLWDDGWWDSTVDELSPSSLSVGMSLVGSRTWLHSTTASRRHYHSSGWGTAGEALAIDALPAMNINTVPSSSGMTRLYLGQGDSESDTDYKTRIEKTTADPRGRWWRIDPVDDPIGSYGDLPLLRWLDPRTGDGLTSFERPPLSITGFGIVAIEGLAQARDDQGRPSTSRRRRTVVQAVPQERPVEAAWTKQGDFEALVRLRHGSWVMAGPHPTTRVADTNASLNNIADWAADPSTGKQSMEALDGAGWLQPAPVCSFAKNPIVNFDWTVPFGLTGAKPWADILKDTTSSKTPSVSIGLTDTQLKATGTTVGALSAEGLRLTAGRNLAWDLDDAGSPITSGANTDELKTRHVSVRFALQSVGDTVLLEARAQEMGVDSDDNGTPDLLTAEANLWRVEYRAANKELVLVIANAALPWGDTERTRRGFAAWKTATDSSPANITTNLADQRCASGGFDFAPADPARTVEFHYAVPSGLEAKRWYHLQVVCASDRPGLHGLILDGVVGRDATRGGVDMNTLGDHFTTPALRLATAITDCGQILGSTLSTPSSISVTYPQTLALTDLLPTRGLVRIDDEYFSYTSLSGTNGSGSLNGVQRARRIVTDQGASEDADGDGTLDTEDTNHNGVLEAVEDLNHNGVLDTEDSNGNNVLDITTDGRRFPVGEAHTVGALVTPGWYQRSIGGAWLRGDCILADDFPAAPVTGTLSNWQDTTPADSVYDATEGSTVKLTPGSGTWPDRGFVQIGSGRRAYFTGGTTGTLTLFWTGAGADGNGSGISATASLTCVLASLRVTGEITSPGGYTCFAPTSSALQLLGSDGACEWIRYNLLADRGADDRYFIREDGWTMGTYATTPEPVVQPRGSMRTPIRSDAWPKDSTKVLPVQTQISGAAGLESGDVVTVTPGPTEATHRAPVQLVVRHAARDGYPATTALSGKQYQTRESWFALAHAVPISVTALPDKAQVLLVGRGWCGDDLSVSDNAPQRRGALPRKLLLAKADGSTPARVYVGGPDPVGAGTAGDLIVDDLCAGALTGTSDANTAASDSAVGGCEITAIGGSTAGAITAATNALPVTVTASQPVFALRNNPLYGLCLIDDEVFAFRRTSDTEAVLIARALLGSTLAAHTLAGNPQTVAKNSGSGTREVSPTLPIVVLPIGPVAELCSTLPAGGYAAGATSGLDVVEVPFSDYYKDPVLFDHPNKDSNAGDPHRILVPPFVVINHPTGGTVEVVRLLHQPQSNRRTTARWLRGLYGTTDQTWDAPYTPATHATTWQASPPSASVTVQAQGSLNPIVIGWWPRFAPPLPTTPSTPYAEALRCRSFAWAGFPLRLSGARFDPGIAVLASSAGGILDVTLDNDGGCSVGVLALAAEEATSNVFDWDKAWPKRKTLTATANASLTDPFDWDRFLNREVDGAEARINWHASSSGSDLASAAAEAGRAPRISLVRLRCVAPTRILAVEEVR